MRGLFSALVLAAVIGLAAPAPAAGQVDGVNIVYPIDGATYGNFVTASFSVTCENENGTVEWKFDSPSSILGSVDFHYQTSVQFVYKVDPGERIFEVTSTCGQIRTSTVKFSVEQ